MTRMRKIVIAGGIGSGKSVVSRVLKVLGYPVYDCDSQARRLMDQSRQIKQGLREIFGAEALLSDETINRPLIASVVFADKIKLSRLNGLVHGAVRADIDRFVDENRGAGLLFIETAIPFESGVDAMADEIWEVTAPVDVRIDRVMNRNGLSRSQVVARIESQHPIPANSPVPVFEIVNDGLTAVLPQLCKALKPGSQSSL